MYNYYYYRYYHIIMTFTQVQIYEISCRKRLILDEILKRKYSFFFPIRHIQLQLLLCECPDVDALKRLSHITSR